MSSKFLFIFLLIILNIVISCIPLPEKENTTSNSEDRSLITANINASSAFANAQINSGTYRVGEELEILLFFDEKNYCLIF